MNKLKIEVEMRVDVDRLYGSFDTAIKYLQEMKVKYPKGNLFESWSGYEDMEMKISYLRLETDEEFQQRVDLKKMVKENKEKLLTKNNLITNLRNQKKELDKKIRLLKEGLND